MLDILRDEAPVDLEGMNMSWNSSAWMPVADKEDTCDIPQLDGPIEEKLGKTIIIFVLMSSPKLHVEVF